jgi:hypothetical protein
MTWVAALVVVASALAGCGKVQQAAARQRAANDLKQIGLLYHNYNDTHKKGPTGADDPALAKMANDVGAQPVLAKVQSGEYVIFWNVKLSNLGKGEVGASETVLGYQKDVPTAGGPVLLGDASVKILTAEEFKAAPKAK